MPSIRRNKLIKLLFRAFLVVPIRLKPWLAKTPRTSELVPVLLVATMVFCSLAVIML